PPARRGGKSSPAGATAPRGPSEPGASPGRSWRVSRSSIMMFVLILLGSPPVTATDHERQNPLYRELRQSGVAVGSGADAPLPEPAMPDGLGREAQLDALGRVIGRDYDLREFVRPSTVAPLKLQLRDVEPSDPANPARGMDVFFI